MDKKLCKHMYEINFNGFVSKPIYDEYKIMMLSFMKMGWCLLFYEKTQHSIEHISVPDYYE